MYPDTICELAATLRNVDVIHGLNVWISDGERSAFCVCIPFAHRHKGIERLPEGHEHGIRKQVAAVFGYLVKDPRAAAGVAALWHLLCVLAFFLAELFFTHLLAKLEQCRELARLSK